MKERGGVGMSTGETGSISKVNGWVWVGILLLCFGHGAPKQSQRHGQRPLWHTLIRMNMSSQWIGHSLTGRNTFCIQSKAATVPPLWKGTGQAPSIDSVFILLYSLRSTFAAVRFAVPTKKKDAQLVTAAK